MVYPVIHEISFYIGHEPQLGEVYHFNYLDEINAVVPRERFRLYIKYNEIGRNLRFDDNHTNRYSRSGMQLKQSNLFYLVEHEHGVVGFYHIITPKPLLTAEYLFKFDLRVKKSWEVHIWKSMQSK